MKVKKSKTILVGDFETTVYEGQTLTEVWASALVKLNSETVWIGNSIDATWALLQRLKGDLVIYYHNLKFDGTFWVSFFLKHNFKLGFDINEIDGAKNYTQKSTRFLGDNEFIPIISDKGMWYSIRVKQGGRIIEFRDSLKLIPFSVKDIGKSFGTRHHKLSMEYTGYRYAGGEITKEEREYIANDVLVVKEALEIMFKDGHNQLTIGSCCLEEFKRLFSTGKFCYFKYEQIFPNMYETEIDYNEYGYKTAGDYILKSYRGGWCYCVKGKENKIYYNGVTADVNSLYPSMMHSMSGNYYPVGYPTFFKGAPDLALFKEIEQRNNEKVYYFLRINCRFKIKEGYLPFIQLKGSLLYKGNEMLESSDYYYKGKRLDKVRTTNNELIPATITMTMTCVDWELFQEHYNIYDLEYLDGCWFHTEIGIFDEYINKYAEIKKNSKGATRTEAKLFLNNLYGKMATTTNSSFKVPRLKDDGSLTFYTQTENGKKPGYIPIGSAITSYARNFTIRTAQMNYYGRDKSGFIYADTDSIHCDLQPDQLKGLTVHKVNFCCWSLESCWDYALFVRQKTYLEHVVKQDLESCEPYLDIKCAGMPKTCKDKLALAINSLALSIEEFDIGLKIGGKLTPKQINGGTLLVETDFTMH